MKFKFEYIVIALLAVALLLQRQCSSSHDIEKVVTKVEIKYDTIEHETPVYYPKWKTRTEVDIDTFTVPIDTMAVLRDYYAKYYYSDTTGTDSVQIVINDTISTNKIASRKVNFRVIYPTVTITRELYKKETQFYYGFGIGGYTKGLTYIGPEVMLKTKANNAYGLGVGINNNFEPSVNFKMYWKIGK
jgi:hypothetical protein